MYRHHRLKDQHDGIVPAWIIDDAAPQEAEQPRLEAPRPHEEWAEEAEPADAPAPGGRVIIIDL